MTPTIISVIILTGALIAAGVGLYVGIIKQLSSVLALVLGVLAGRFFGATVALELGLHVFVGSAIVAVGVYLAVMILTKILRKTAHFLLLGPLDRTLGAIVSVICWLAFASLLLNLYVLSVPETTLLDSAFTQWTLDFLPMLIGTAENLIQ